MPCSHETHDFSRGILGTYHSGLPSDEVIRGIVEYRKTSNYAEPSAVFQAMAFGRDRFGLDYSFCPEICQLGRALRPEEYEMLRLRDLGEARVEIKGGQLVATYPIRIDIVD